MSIMIGDVPYREAMRVARWYDTYNSVLQGIYAAETSHLTPAFTERSHKHAARAADLTHGALTTAEP